MKILFINFIVLFLMLIKMQITLVFVILLINLAKTNPDYVLAPNERLVYKDDEYISIEVFDS